MQQAESPRRNSSNSFSLSTLRDLLDRPVNLTEENLLDFCYDGALAVSSTYSLWNQTCLFFYGAAAGGLFLAGSTLFDSKKVEQVEAFISSSLDRPRVQAATFGWTVANFFSNQPLNAVSSGFLGTLRLKKLCTEWQKKKFAEWQLQQPSGLLVSSGTKFNPTSGKKLV